MLKLDQLQTSRNNESFVTGIVKAGVLCCVYSFVQQKDQVKHGLRCKIELICN